MSFKKRAAEKDSFETKELRQILAFRVGGREMGLDLSCVREVLRSREVYSLPKTLNVIEGVISLRGHILPLIDLGKRFHEGRGEDVPNQRIIICKVKKFVVGLAVSDVEGIVAVQELEIKPAPELMFRQRHRDPITGLLKAGERIIALLNLDHLVAGEEIAEGSVVNQ
jgi:purine-binding chemotaxis protein CheW